MLLPDRATVLDVAEVEEMVRVAECDPVAVGEYFTVIVPLAASLLIELADIEN